MQQTIEFNKLNIFLHCLALTFGQVYYEQGNITNEEVREVSEKVETVTQTEYDLNANVLKETVTTTD